MKKIKGILNGTNIINYLTLSMILISGFVCIFIFSTGILSYDLYDYIEGVFFSEATLKSSSLINPEYIYFYVIPFASNIIMAPFVKLFGTTMLANQMGMIVFYLIYIGTSFKLSSALFPEDKKSKLLFMSVLSMFIYTYVGDNLLHHILMYGIGFVCFIGELSCVIEIGRNNKVEKNTVLLIFLCLWSAANGFSAALSNIPLIIAIVIVKLNRKSLNKKENKLLLITILMVTVIGLLLFLYMNSIAISLDKYKIRLSLDTNEKLVENLVKDLPKDYLKLFYYIPENDPVFSARGMFMLIKLFSAFAVIALPLAIGRIEKKKGNTAYNENECILYLSNIIIIVVCLLEYALVVTSVLRYLFNAALSMTSSEIFPTGKVLALSPLNPIYFAPTSTLTMSPSFKGLSLGKPWTISSLTEAQMVAGKPSKCKNPGLAPWLII